MKTMTDVSSLKSKGEKTEKFSRPICRHQILTNESYLVGSQANLKPIKHSCILQASINFDSIYCSIFPIQFSEPCQIGTRSRNWKFCPPKIKALKLLKAKESKKKKKQEMAKTFVGEDSCQNISCAVKMALIELVPNKPIYKTERKTFASLFI